MPLTVAPPPRNGDAAQGNWRPDAPALPVADPAGARPDAPEPVPTLPASAAIARTVAAGVLLSAAALAIAATLVFLVAALRLLFAGDVRLTFDGTSPALVTAALAIGCAAALATPFWPWPARRPFTLALAAVVTAAWPLSGAPLPSAAAAIVALGLALARDRHIPGGLRATCWLLAGPLALVATAAAIAGVALAHSHPARPAPARTGSAVATLLEKVEPPASETPSTPAAEASAPVTARETPSTPAETPAPLPIGGTSPTNPLDAPATGETPPTNPLDAPEAPAAIPTPAAPAEDASPDHGDPPATTDTPAITADAPSAADAKAYVRAYYAALDERRYDDAWAELSPAIRKQFGGFGPWKAGYAKTVSSEPQDLTTTEQGESLLVSLRLVARERGCAARSFRMTWTLVQASGKWSVTGLRGTPLGDATCS